MVEKLHNQVIVVASWNELMATQRIWGTGGWLMPEQREALDWLTLTRLLGWGVTVTRQKGTDLDENLSDGSHCIILACDPDSLGDQTVAWLSSRLATESILVVARAGSVGSALAQLSGSAQKSGDVLGRSLCWIGPGVKNEWQCRKMFEVSTLHLSEEVAVWATVDDMPIIAARKAGRGMVATLSFNPSQARDAEGAVTALLRHLLIWGSAAPLAWLDFTGTMVLRMDDPGGAQNVFKKDWLYPKLDEDQWSLIGEDLYRRNARLSIGYVAGWVDDGDIERGVLEVDGKPPRRPPGGVHPSPVVMYRDVAGYTPGRVHDYKAEFRGIQALRAAGLGDIELHGYTHMHPDSASWAKAPDRYETWPETSWYRELGSAAQAAITARPPEQHPLNLGLVAFRRHFDVAPTTLICPGDQWTNEVLEHALDLGLQLMSSYYLALRDGDRFCWVSHVCAPYLDEPNTAWFDAGLPVVGYFHDRELALEGVAWMSKWLDRWQEAGARRFIDFRELAAAVGRRLYLEQAVDQISLTVERGGAPPFVKPLPILIKVVDRQMPSQISVSLDGKLIQAKVYSFGKGIGRIILPV